MTSRGARWLPRARLWRWWAVLAVLLCGLGHATRGLAWAERRVESSTTYLELAADGSAIVRHQLMLEARGAPLETFRLEGVDADAEPLPDATITRTQGGRATSSPQPLNVTLEDGALKLEVGMRKGFRGRHFLLQFAYRTRLLARGLLRPVGPERVELAWVGPRFEDGVDSVTLVVRTAAAPFAPELVKPTDATVPGPIASHGIVMSTLRRSQARDELELVRAHVARHEAMTWRVRLAAQLFTAPLPGIDSSPGAAAPRAAAPEPKGAGAWPAPALPLRWLALSGFAYAVLVWLKARSVRRASSVRGCAPRGLLPLRAPLRAGLAGACFAAAATLAAWGEAPTLAALLLLLSMACAAHRPPLAKPQLRGPGQWRALEPKALAASPGPALAGAWLDVGRASGFVLLMSLLAAATALSARLFETSPYFGACALLGSSALLPVFCTGRAGELPLDPVECGRRFARRLARRLRRRRDLLVQPVARFAEANGAPDELRLAVTPERGLPGLVGLEVALEFQSRIGGFSARPVVVVRVAEGSPCQLALPRSLIWSRGRTSEERATLVRPKLPGVAATAALVQELLEVMAGSLDPRRNAARSAGNGLSTANAATTSSPAHAT